MEVHMPLRLALPVFLSWMTLSCDDGSPPDDTGSADRDGDGWSAGLDCDDATASTHPGAYEACDGMDNDCDGFTDHEDPEYDGGTWYADADADGWGAGDALCAGGTGTSAVAGDCDDLDPEVRPDAEEVCNGWDDDCDGFVDDADDSLDTSTRTSWYPDADGDGYGIPAIPWAACLEPDDMAANSTDCDDGDPTAFPGSHATEVPGDGVDQDCDGLDACTDLDCDGWTDLVLPGWGTGGDPAWDLEDDAIASRGTPGAGAGTALYPCADGACPTDKLILLDTTGVSSAVAEDLDGDGYLDLALGVYGSRGTPAGRTQIWWGGPDGFDPGSRTLLEVYGVRRLRAADLDHDGWIDLVAAVARRDDDSWEASSAVWWGSAAGFVDVDRLTTPGAQDVVVADLDGDGDEDLAFACARDDSSFNIDSYVYWNQRGFSGTYTTALPTSGASRVLAEDLDDDGDQDLFFVAFRGARTYRADSMVYWNHSGDFSAGQHTALYAQGGIDAVAEDLDADGWPDLLVAHWRSDSGYLADSRIWWGSSSGFDASSGTSVASDGAAGIAVADLDGNGSLDIVVAETRNNDGPKDTSTVLWAMPGVPRGYSLGSVAISGATGVLAEDLDDDGWIDLVFSGGGSVDAPSTFPAVVWNRQGILSEPVPLSATGSLIAPLATGP
jgi:hypothetical protein